MADELEKPRVRVRAGRGQEITADAFVNWAANIGANSLAQQGTWDFNPITRERMLLEFMYRGSWVCGVAIDAIAEDMTKLGIDYSGTMPPDDAETLENEFNRLQLWQQLCNLIKWGRLYGGAIAIIVIAGQDWSTPLRLESVGPRQFKGLVVLDRWMVEPSLNDLVSQPGPDHGLPKYYRTHADAMTIPPSIVHYSRVIRYEGVHLPYWQRIQENLWGTSIYERLWNRLLAYDSTTEGTAQLVYKAYLRYIKIKNLREMIAGQPSAKRMALMAQVNFMRQMQSNEGISMIDADDEFGTTTYSFAGLDNVLLQMGQQLCGAIQMPGVRLFGQSPQGLNATGDSDWRNYFDGLHQQQESRLRPPVQKVVTLAAASTRVTLPDKWNFQFRSLWQMTTKEKAETADLNTRTILAAFELGLVGEKTVLEELRQSGRETGVWGTVSDQMIDNAAELAPPRPAFEPPSRLGPTGGGPGGGGPGGGPGQSQGPGGRLSTINPQNVTPFRPSPGRGQGQGQGGARPPVPMSPPGLGRLGGGVGR